MTQTSTSGIRFSLELVAMLAVIAISSWHIGHYMATFDGWRMAAIMGATLGFCNFLMAHNLFRAGSTNRLPSFVGLVFFATTSTFMQYTYFNDNPDIGQTWLWGINLDALTLGIWAPAAEILLGWIYAAGHGKSDGERTGGWGARFDRLGNAMASRLEQRLVLTPLPASPEQSNREAAMVHPTVQVNGRMESLPEPESGSKPELSKPQAQTRCLQLFAADPHATYESIAEQIGRSKTTVHNYLREFEQRGWVEISETAGVDITEAGHLQLNNDLPSVA